LEIISVIVDSRSQCTFDVPRKHLSAVCTKYQPESVNIKPYRESDGPGFTANGIYLPGVPVADFSDFVNWTRSGRILPNPPSAVEPEWFVEHSTRRIISALSLGISLSSSEYQKAAICELFAIAPLLEWPEDFVNSIFTACKLSAHDDHPAQRLWVAVVAAKTAGEGKRNVRVGPRMKHVDGDERVRSTTFWKMFDAYVEAHGRSCEYPGMIDEYLQKL
jgi:hypothetical protein